MDEKIIFNNQIIEIKNNNYNLQNIFGILNYDYKKYFKIDNMFCSKKEILNIIFDNEEFKEFILKHDFDININNIPYKNHNNYINIILDINNEPWFKGKDINNILGHSNDNLIQISNEDKIIINDINFTNNNDIYINLFGVHYLILLSKNKTSKHFKQWLTENCLPSIKKFETCKLFIEKDIKLKQLIKENDIFKEQIIILESVLRNIKPKS